MLFPEKMDDGVAVVFRARSACVAVATTSVTVAAFAPNDWFAAFTVAVSVITVPLVAVALTLYKTVKVPEAPAATLGFVHTVGKAVQVHPAGGVIETKVVPVGVASVKVAVVAADAPVLVTVCV
jgi:hypothetical protein